MTDGAVYSPVDDSYLKNFMLITELVFSEKDDKVAKFA
jgi:hypothetical protein